MTVEVGDDTDYEPDAVVNCGPRPAPQAVAAPNPVVVVEVVSPSTQRVDMTGKLTAYFRVPSIQHYVIVRLKCREVIHHRRDGGRIEVQVLAGRGVPDLSPPGIAVEIADFFAGLDEQETP